MIDLVAIEKIAERLTEEYDRKTLLKATILFYCYLVIQAKIR